jgi:Sulfite oxidase and related enzymes
MRIRTTEPHPVKPSEIASETVWLARRRLLAQGAVAFAGLALAGCSRADTPNSSAAEPAGAGEASGTDLAKLRKLPVSKRMEMAGGEALSSTYDVTHYNNYYEFGTSKSAPARNAGTLITRPWTVDVGGECAKPGQLAIDDFIPYHQLEERVYRHRCVEAWSIVVPWVGFPLGAALKRFEPTSKAKYVAFETLYAPKEMPEAGDILPWPYREGLRMDEAMHPLAFLSVGMFGRVMPNQDGAPLRLTIPWKYGFKSIKSIVRIRFVEQQPPTTWNTVGPSEYGFYANVNPKVPHPRWSQAEERRLGDLFPRKTLMFNGYDQVASLYAGMDLHKDF